MNSQLRPQSVRRPVRLLICAVLAATITAVTTQLIASAAGQHPYGIAWTTPPPATIPIAGA